jgi:hypothetical protein
MPRGIVERQTGHPANERTGHTATPVSAPEALLEVISTPRGSGRNTIGPPGGMKAVSGLA